MTLLATSSDLSPAAPASHGAIILARHGEPALSHKCLLTSDQYRDWWARYEVGGLLAGQTPPPELLARLRDTAN